MTSMTNPTYLKIAQVLEGTITADGLRWRLVSGRVFLSLVHRFDEEIVCCACIVVNPSNPIFELNTFLKWQWVVRFADFFSISKYIETETETETHYRLREPIRCVKSEK